MKYLKTYDEKCSGCNTCVEVCSTLYLKENSAEKSRIVIEQNPKAGFHITVCDQCGLCVSECPVLALTVNKLGVVMLNSKLCINCLACMAVCPSNSMRHYPGALAPIKCIACDACAKNCPQDALEIVEEVR